MRKEILSHKTLDTFPRRDFVIFWQVRRARPYEISPLKENLQEQAWK